MTGEEISNLTDEQINVMMTKCVHDASWCTKYDSENKWIYEDDSDQGVANGIKVADYCNDPAVM